MIARTAITKEWVLITIVATVVESLGCTATIDIPQILKDLPARRLTFGKRLKMKIGDRVTVQDEGLEMLASTMRKYGHAPKVPNNVGVIDEIQGDTAFIIFDDSGQCAPYFLTECFVIEES